MDEGLQNSDYCVSFLRASNFSHSHTRTHDNIVLRQSWDGFYCLCFCDRCAAIVDIWCYCYCVDCCIVVAMAADWHTCFPSANQDWHSPHQIIPSSSDVTQSRVTAHRRPGSFFMICGVGLPLSLISTNCKFSPHFSIIKDLLLVRSSPPGCSTVPNSIYTKFQEIYIYMCVCLYIYTYIYQYK